MRVFGCPFRDECWKARREQEATLYADNEILKSYLPNICIAPFLESEGGGPICVLEVDRNKLTLENYLSKAETLRIHRPKNEPARRSKRSVRAEEKEPEVIEP